MRIAVASSMSIVPVVIPTLFFRDLSEICSIFTAPTISAIITVNDITAFAISDQLSSANDLSAEAIMTIAVASSISATPVFMFIFPMVLVATESSAITTISVATPLSRLLESIPSKIFNATTMTMIAPAIVSKVDAFFPFFHASNAPLKESRTPVILSLTPDVTSLRLLMNLISETSKPPVNSPFSRSIRLMNSPLPSLLSTPSNSPSMTVTTAFPTTHNTSQTFSKISINVHFSSASPIPVKAEITEDAIEPAIDRTLPIIVQSFFSISTTFWMAFFTSFHGEASTSSVNF